MRKLLVAAIIIGALGWFGEQAEATPDWYTCDVNMVGQGWGAPYLYVRFTDAGGAFANKWWITASDATQANRMLALALTAINGGLQVKVWVDPAAEYSQIGAFYVIGQ